MTGLEGKKCVPCEGGIPPLNEEESMELIGMINDNWALIDNHHIERIWEFNDFQDALKFVNLAGMICEEEGHHANFEISWGRAKALIWTHKIDGLTESDFILAAKIDELE
tara:strand:+ start:343 stop:672 length:330 start_codon:yes stop_codon:yes gene_type:complete